MKTLALIIIAAFFISVPAIAQDIDQQIQSVNIKILQLSAQRDYNNQAILDLARKAVRIDDQIQQLGAQRQKLTAKKAEVPEEPEK